MARIPEDFLDALLSRIDIVDVIEQYVPLKKAGQNYMACCPFHKEKSPSFTVSPTKQFYHCFGCGVHGSAIGFMMEYANLSFPDAVGQLAQRVGLTVPTTIAENAQRSVRGEEKLSLADLMQTAMHFYRQALKASPQAIAYLKARGLSGQVAARFGLGFAPGGENQWRELQQVFPDYANNEALVECGLVIVNKEKQSRYDRFRGRVMFPIFNQRNQVIGFGGRVLGQGEPKYLNSPETPLFEKGRELYGLTHARAAIREQGRALVVEGYMDVVALAQHGVEYAVATLGTACTTAQVQKLIKLTDEIVFCFDGDKAGRKAAWRALENSLPLLQDGKKLTFLFLPAEHDPDSYIQTYGKAQFEKQLQNDAVPLGNFLLRELASQVELESHEGRAKLMHLAKPYLVQIRARALNLMLKRRLAELCRLEIHEVNSLLGSKTKPARRKWQLNPNNTKVNHLRVEQKLLRLVLFEPSLALDKSCTGLLMLDYHNSTEKLLSEVLDFIQNNPHIKLGVSVVEAFHGHLYKETLERELNAGVTVFSVFSHEELKAEWLATAKKFGQSQKIPAKLDRKTELEYKAANGGLTETEKQEYLSLLQRN
jgi:DNA primase